jgi:glycosidase
MEGNMPASVRSQEVLEVFRKARIPGKRKILAEGKTVEIPYPFPSPLEWRDEWIYFVFLDRFNNPASPPHHLPWDSPWGEFQGGTIDGVRRQLGYIRGLGAGAIWLSPVVKNCQYTPYTYHGYGIQDFLSVDPRFTSDPDRARRDPAFADSELRGLVDEAHAIGLYVIFDIVLNHTGDVFAYEGYGGDAPWSDEPYPICWRDGTGRARPEWREPPGDPPPDAAVWPKELQRKEYFRRRGKGGELAGDFEILKELTTDYTENHPVYGVHFPVRETLIKAHQYLIAKFDIDGFRIDTLKFIEPCFSRIFANAVREFALDIGKKNFFTFGEIWDSEEKISGYIGRFATEKSDLIGVDAALDYPLFYQLAPVVKGSAAPTDLIAMFDRRRSLENGIISSQGEASKFFVTFIDNHDQHARFHFVDPAQPARYDPQLKMALACLFSLQGIPCMYYGTEQGLHGSGDRPEAVREALWGKTHAFDRENPFSKAVSELAALRRDSPPLRYGRQYFRQVSGDGIHFGFSPFPGGVLAFSRILSGEEILIVANTNTNAPWAGEVVVDYAVNQPGETYKILYGNIPGSRSEIAICEKKCGSVEIREIGGGLSCGPTRILPVRLAPMEIQILGSTALPEQD